jgi:hypothetical protein
MNNPSANPLDFDAWANLAKEDPDAFENLRRHVINRAIHKIPSDQRQKRIQGLQWRIDSLRQTSKTPMAACLKLYDMMWDTVLQENGLLDCLQGQKPGKTDPQQAKVLQFTRKPLL